MLQLSRTYVDAEHLQLYVIRALQREMKAAGIKKTS